MVAGARLTEKDYRDLPREIFPSSRDCLHSVLRRCFRLSTMGRMLCLVRVKDDSQWKNIWISVIVMFTRLRTRLTMTLRYQFNSTETISFTRLASSWMLWNLDFSNFRTSISPVHVPQWKKFYHQPECLPSRRSFQRRALGGGIIESLCVGWLCCCYENFELVLLPLYTVDIARPTHNK